jgi:Domain of unknown function (DUF4150)
MSLTVSVNDLTLVHQGSDGKAICSAPDACKTPPQNLPVPYVNVAFSKDLQNGSVTVSADGGNPCAMKDSYFAPSEGDEPGEGGGVVSGVNKGQAKFSNYSTDVKIEGRNAARLTDPMTMNGNGPNTDTAAELQQNLGGESYQILCQIFCWCDAGKKGKDFVQKPTAAPGSQEA